MSTGRVDGRTARSERTRSAILDAAIDLLCADGAAQVTHRAVATRAGTSLAATTYHFGSLDDLLIAAFEQLTERTVAQVRNYSDQILAGEGDLVEAAVEFAETTLGAGADGLIELVHTATRHDRLRKSVQHYVEQLAGPFAALIGEDAAATLVRSLTGVLLHHRATDPAPTSTTELRADLTRLFRAFGLTDAVTHHLQEEISP